MRNIILHRTATFVLCLFMSLGGFSQAVGINTDNLPDDAVLHIYSDPANPAGVLFPSFTTLDRNKINVKSEGLSIYNLSTKRYEMWNGSTWTDLNGGVWNHDSNNHANIWHDPGYVGIQAQHPESPLHVAGNSDAQITVHRTGQVNGRAQIIFKNTNEGVYIGMNEHGDFGVAPTHTPNGAMLNIEQNKPGELKVNGQVGGVVPKGGIIMWSGRIIDIPEGWALCDGTQGTPNLSGRFVVGYDKDDADYQHTQNTGGNKRVTLQENELPKHTHSFSGTTNNDGAHKHTFYLGKHSGSSDGGFYLWGGNYGGSKQFHTETDGSHQHQFSGTTSPNDTNGQAHENRPPYFVIAYIMKT